jgi:acetylornithine deacetylase/succinyl-diaminopimelate desuccinylase family protein
MTEVQSWLSDRAGEMADLLVDLVAINTENPPGRNLGSCGLTLLDAMSRLGFAPDLIKLPANQGLEEPCVVRGSVGNGPQTIYFHGHFDVVPAQDRSQFDPKRMDNKIFGRGTADMKGGLVSMLYGAAAAREFGLLRNGMIVFHFVCDEETGSVAGSGRLREEGAIDPEALAMVTAEPTGDVIWHANRGAITLRVNVHGKPAHVGQAHLGVNAFEHMIRVAEPLSTLSHRLLEERTAFTLESEEARGSMLVLGGAAGSGANFNVVPGSAWFSVDRRFNPEEDLDEELERLQSTIADAAKQTGAEVTVDLLQRQPSSATDVNHPTARALSRCVAEVEGSPPRFELCPGVLETRWYAQLGIPSFAYGGGRLDVSHGPNEYIEEEAMRRCAAVYALFARKLFRA